jgi:hypothetical protein
MRTGARIAQMSFDDPFFLELLPQRQPNARWRLDFGGKLMCCGDDLAEVRHKVQAGVTYNDVGAHLVRQRRPAPFSEDERYFFTLHDPSLRPCLQVLPFDFGTNHLMCGHAPPNVPNAVLSGDLARRSGLDRLKGFS